MATLKLSHLGVLAAFLCACGGGLPSVTPSVSISSPNNNATVSLPANRQVPVDFTSNYSLKAPGTCAGADNCGHVYVLIDSSACNPQGVAYNNLAVSSPTFADLSKCTMATGSHRITLELKHDDGTPVMNLTGSPVTDSRTITVQ
jgi:hypothetical protein